MKPFLHSIGVITNPPSPLSRTMITYHSTHLTSNNPNLPLIATVFISILVLLLTLLPNGIIDASHIKTNRA